MKYLLQQYALKRNYAKSTSVQYPIKRNYRAGLYEERRASYDPPGGAEINTLARRIFRGFRSPRKNERSYRDVIGLYGFVSSRGFRGYQFFSN